MTIRSDVIIAGLGPTGATLANLLGDMTFINLEKEVILSWPRPGDLGPHQWHPSYRFHQPALETALREGLAAFYKVTLRTGCQARSLQQFEDCVRVTMCEQSTDVLEVMEGKYLVGCDGGRSAVRGLVGTPLQDLGSHQQWLVVDLLMKRDVPGLTEGTVQFCDPKRPTTFMRCVGQRRRWEFMMMPDDDVQALTRTEGVWSLLSPWLTPEDADIERATPCSTATNKSVLRMCGQPSNTRFTSARSSRPSTPSALRRPPRRSHRKRFRGAG